MWAKRHSQEGEGYLGVLPESLTLTTGCQHSKESSRNWQS